MQKSLRRLKVDNLLDGAILALVLVLANIRTLIFYPRFPEVTTICGVAWKETLAWLVLTGLTLWAVSRRGYGQRFMAFWKLNWSAGLFVIFAGLSLTWSVFFLSSLYRYIGMLCTSLVAVYLGIRYRPKDWLAVLFWTGAILAILCLAFAVILPEMGTHPGYPYYGAWRGILRHKINLGQAMALFNAVFALGLLAAVRDRERRGVLHGFLYLLSLLLIVMSHSVGAYLTTLVLNGLVGVYWLWLIFRRKLKVVHYWMVLGVLLAMLAMILLNANRFLGVFGRDSSLTGRIPMWEVLLRNHISQRPVIGFGFGSVWEMPMFRLEMGHEAGWDSQIGTADNGFLDVMLQLGAIGLGLFLLALGQAGLRAGRHVWGRKTLEDFYPVLSLAWILVANVAFSLLFETESFSWLILIVAMAMTTRGVGLSAGPHQREVLAEADSTMVES